MSADTSPESIIPEPIAIHMTCGCNAQFNMSAPVVFIDVVTKQANTWQKFHACSVRQTTTQSEPRANDAWLKQGLGLICITCGDEITEDGTEWWKVAGHWVHLDCVTCQKCNLPARRNGTMLWNETVGQEGFYHVRCPT